MKRLASLLAALVAVGHAQSAADQEVLDQAAATVEKYCSVLDGLEPLDVDAAREDLEGGAGEDNFIVRLVEEAGAARQAGGSAREIAEALADIADPGFIAGKAFAVVLAIILFVLWLLCCWFVCCPCCCKCCCRCCQRKWATGKVFKAVLWLLFIAFGVAAVIMVSTSMTGASSIDTGIQGTACSAAILVQDAVAGSPESNFTGLLPAYDTLNGLASLLNANSQFMTDLSAILDSTKDISAAANLAVETIKLLEAALADPANQAPRNAGGDTMYHTCAICGPLSTVLNELRTTLASSTGEQMKNLREEIDNQLQGPGLSGIRSSIAEAMAPIEAAKDAFLEQVGYFVREDGFQSQTAPIAGENSQLQPGVLAFFSFYLIIVVSAILALGAWSYADKHGEKPEGCCVRFCTGCVSCSACLYAMIVLLIAGIMVIVAMFGSGICLVMIDFNQDTGANLFSAVGQDVPDEVMTALKIADRCFSLTYPENANFSRNLADIVDIPSTNATLAARGETSTIREELYALAIDPIETQINAALGSFTGNSPPAMADDPKLTELLSMIGSLDMEALYLPVESEISASTQYQAMTSTTPMNPNPFAAYLAVPLNCLNVTLSSALGSEYGGVSMPGLSAMILDGFTLQGQPVPPLADYANPGVVWDCTTKTLGMVCKDGTSGTMQEMALYSQTKDACDASAAFVSNVKVPLTTQSVFKCHYMYNADGTRCRPSQMTRVSAGNWVGTCGDADGRIITRTAENCTLAAYEQNIKDFEDDLKQVFRMFDDITVFLLDDITVNLKDLVQDSVITPIVNLLNNLNCGFMRAFWQGLTDNMCYRGMNGFRLIANSYVISGLLSLCIAGLIFIPWKISRDNKDKYQVGEAGATTL